MAGEDGGIAKNCDEKLTLQQNTEATKATREVVVTPKVEKS